MAIDDCHFPFFVWTFPFYAFTISLNSTLTFVLPQNFF